MTKTHYIHKIIARLTAALLLVVMAFDAVACNSGTQDATQNTADIPQNIGSHALGNTGISVYTEMIKVDLEYGSKTLGFPLYFVSDKILDSDKIEFVRLEGENVDYFDQVKLNRRQVTDVTDQEINGKYLYLYNVDSRIDIDYFTPLVNVERPEVWKIRIDSIIVKIDGKEYSIKLANPVKYNYNEENYNDISGNHMYGPIMVYTFGLTETYFANIHNYSNDIKVKDFYFSDFLDVQNKQLYYKETYLGNLNGETLYPVNKRSQNDESAATVYYNAVHSDKYTGSDFDYILCTSVVEYTIEGDDTVYRMKFPFNSQGLGSRETAEEFLEYIDSLN